MVVKSTHDENLKSRTLSSLFWKFFERAGNQLIQLAVQILLARLLAPEYFGALAIMMVLVSVGTVLVQSGLGTAIIQSPEITSDDCSSVFWLSFAIACMLYMTLFAFAPAIAAFYSMAELVWPIRVLSLMLVIGSYNAVQGAIVSRNLQFKKFFYATVAAVLSSGFIGIALALFGFGLWALVAQQLVSSCVNCIVMARQVEWRPRLVFDGKRVRELFRFGWKLLASSLLDTVYQSLSDLIIGRVFSAYTLGLVAQGKRYPNALGSLLDGSIQPVMLSAISRIQHDTAYVKRLVRRALRTSTYVVFPAMTFFALAAEPLVLLLLGDQWIACVPFLQIYCFVYALLPIHTTNLQALNGLGRSDIFLALELVKKAYGLAILLVAAFIIRDVYAIVVGYMVAGVIGTFVNAYPGKKIYGYGYCEQLKDIAPALVLSVVSGFFASLLSFAHFSPLCLLIMQAFVMFGSYLLLSKAFRLESLNYLLLTAKDLFGKKMG